MTDKYLLLLRHAKSDWGAGVESDFARPLNARGRADAPKMGRWLAANHRPQVIAGSPSARTTETIELVAEALQDAGGAVAEITYHRHLYHPSAAGIIDTGVAHLHECERVLVVAHNPGMEEALLACCPGAAPFADGKLMPTCALAVIRYGADADLTDPATGELCALLRPADLPA